MAKNNIQESQQQGQGVALGTQGNQDMKIPGTATHGSHRSKEGKEDRHIPNQERSSAANQERSQDAGQE
jgi:hypothetical protein